MPAGTRALDDRRLVEDISLDPRDSSTLAHELPGLATAFDPHAMLPLLQDALFDGSTRYEIEVCRPGQGTYLPGEGCLLRYELEVTDRAGERTLTPLVAARIFRTPLACTRYFEARLAPLAERARGRPELGPFARPVAVLSDLNAALAVYPIDGELPTLVDATDPSRIAEILRRALPEAVAGRFDIRRCRVDRGHYGRQHRCVLRYEVEGVVAGTEAEERQVVYGKVAADGRGALAGAALTALRDRMSEEPERDGFGIPASLAFDPQLQLLLVEALPGTPVVARLLAARVGGAVPAERSGLTLEGAIDVSARVAAALHASGITLGPRREFAEDLAGLGLELQSLRRISADLAERLDGWRARTEESLRGSDPLRTCFSHGDFRHTQLIFEGTRCGLVDFDTVCQAEPALDLGHFLAYLRLAVLKARRPGGVCFEDLADELCERFLSAYVTEAGRGLESEARLRERVAAFEMISILRLALHSWRKFKPGRLAYAITLLEERGSCLVLPKR